jgi:hypothetical protein
MLVALLSAIPPVSASIHSQAVATSSPTPVSDSSSATSGDASTTVAQPTPASVAEYMVAAAFTTSFRGKDYSATVEHANGVYTGAVANLPGADTSGASVQVVETNLGRMVDTLA